jgi:hypothetical protein
VFFGVGGEEDRERKRDTQNEREFCGGNEGFQQLVTGWWHVF